VLSADKPRAPAFLRVLYHAPDWLTWLLLADPSQRRFYGRAATAQRIAADKAMLARDKSTVRGLIAQAAAIADYRTTREAIAGLTMPALVVHGDADTLVPFAWGEELALILPGARLVRCEGSGHNFMVAAPDKANAAVLEFLREVDRGAA
jgi:pimeloyl-ACP methyl ester carboxylesterase